MILAGDAWSKLKNKKKTCKFEPIIAQLLQDLRSVGKNPTTLCANSVLEVFVCLCFIYTSDSSGTNCIIRGRLLMIQMSRRLYIKANLALQLCQLPTPVVQLFSLQSGAHKYQDISLLTHVLMIIGLNWHLAVRRSTFQVFTLQVWIFVKEVY